MLSTMNRWGCGWRILSLDEQHHDRFCTNLDTLSVHYSGGKNYFERDYNEYPFYVYVSVDQCGDDKLREAFSSANSSKKKKKKKTSSLPAPSFSPPPSPTIGPVHDYWVDELENETWKDEFALESWDDELDSNGANYLSVLDGAFELEDSLSLQYLSDIEQHIDRLSYEQRRGCEKADLLIHKFKRIEESLREMTKQLVRIDKLDEFIRKEALGNLGESDRLKGAAEEFTKQLAERDRRLRVLQTECDEAHAEWHKSENAKNSLKDQLSIANRNLVGRETQFTNGHYFSNFVEVLAALEKRHPLTLVVTEQAMKSAREFDKKYKLNREEVYRLSHWVESLATHLVPLLGRPKAKKLTAKFKESASYDLAFTETKPTKMNHEFIKLRQLTYAGETVTCLSHIKLRIGTIDARTYFHIDNEKNIVVIGPCGSHLHTAGTRRRS